MKKYLAMFDDYTGIPRAWACSADQVEAERVASEQLGAYCEKQRGLEPMLADVRNYTLRVETYEEKDPVR